jgi:hypothetical protein
MTQDRCPSCGAAVAGGRAGCQSLFDELSAAAYNDVRRASMHQLLVDAYSMQHPEEYGRSGKSYAAHLMRLCCGVELKADPATYESIRRWLDGGRTIAKPALLTVRGAVTVADVARVADDAYAAAVRDWARVVWTAYSDQHALAREWVDSALGRSRSR